MKHLILIVTSLFMLNMSSFAQSTQFDMSVFPKPDNGWMQHVIHLPEVDRKEMSNYKIEFYIGKYAEVDMCNTFGLIGELQEKELSGYGYNYFRFDTDGNVMGTLMGCSDRSMQTKFVKSRSLTMDYNSNMPIVVYTPKGYEVRYKIFKASKFEYKAQILK